MTDDATLSNFVSADEADSDADSDPAADPGTAANTDRKTDADVGANADANTNTHATDTGHSTFAWGEYTCDRCGNATERAWRDDGDLVCPNCKKW
ncbi:DUF7573 domain-containing protein [Natrinema salifodinae]|uniref:DUF7573 domain-containing protein n=1 Tax=Natrinema salifodinae TaxID=1202768 RepID=A0A1I0PTP2_9EURY|nr:hypothetical protein [Natrinema salifodinae]SEW17770.1 hypothetical protein SAMN05216285_2934 [Natrinema salifodinae]